MYGPGNKWNWIFEDKHYGEVGTRGDRIIMQSRYNETIETYREAIDEASKAFMWFLAVRLLRGDDHPTFILRGFEDV